MEGIEIKAERVGALKDVALFKVNGYVDTTTSPELQKLLTQNIEAGFTQYIIDLAAVHYVSSAGWGVFVGEIRTLREGGGDLKLIHMTPEVIEVFEMLEFNRILACYDSLEEAIDDFDFCRDIHFQSTNLFAATSGGVVPLNVPMTPTPVPVPVTPKIKESTSAQSTMLDRQRHIDDAQLPLTEKVKKLVIENPMVGLWTIKRSLYSPRFGYTKIGFLRLRSIMKRLGLETRAKRYRYFRSR
ncbi:MAG: STAS domain-containing protein [Calditrichaeota bacterium]|nr:STAS domain-containing protein [Calditrichota bacterium]